MTHKQKEKELKQLRAENAHLRGTLEDFCCDGCEYGDDCPSGANHYVCRACQAQRALDFKND